MIKISAPTDVLVAIAIVAPFPPEEFWFDGVEVAELDVGLDLRP